MQAAESYVSKFPTEETRRRMRAAQSLVFLSHSLGKEVSDELIEMSKNELCDTFAHDRNLRNMMSELYDTDIERHDQLLLGSGADNVQLRAWWNRDCTGDRDYSAEPLLLLRQVLKDKKQLHAGRYVPIKHVTGKPTRWIREGDLSWPDPKSKEYTVFVEPAALEARTKEGLGGGKWLVIVQDSWSENLTHETTITTYDIVYAEDGKLTTGHVKRPNHLPTTQVSKEKPKKKG